MNGGKRRRERNRRVFIVLLGMSAVLAVLTVRLAWLQLMPAAPASSDAVNLKRESVAQRERPLVLDSGRGDFLDRHGLALTGESYKALAAFPVQQAARGFGTAEFARLAAILGVKADKLERWMRELKEPRFWMADGSEMPYKLNGNQLAAIESLHVAGVRVLPYRNRYPSAFEAKHVIGYISQHPELLRTKYERELAERKMKLSDTVGGAGLERSLDKLLRGTGPTSVSYFTDGSNKPLGGLDFRLTGSSNPYYPLQVKTTLDLPLQNAVESYVDAQGLREGAVVILDADNGDIAAMVSRPRLSISDLGRTGTDTANHALRAITPGSIFKLVTAAAALEAGLTAERETFQCNGEYGRYGLHCWKEGGHGRVTLKDALAQSCNVALATVAERLTPLQLAVTADKLGIGRKVGWYDPKPFAPLGTPLQLLLEEEPGRLFVPFPVRKDGGQMAQTGIGQRDVTMTPLQAANLVLTLLHDGVVSEPRLVSEIRYANGQRMAALPRLHAPSQYGRIRPSTARVLLRGMEAVVADGTAESISHRTWRLAGKSGTAEALNKGVPVRHQWFAGYGPAKRPRYVAAVLVMNRAPGSPNKATALFGGIMDLLAERSKAGERS